MERGGLDGGVLVLDRIIFLYLIWILANSSTAVPLGGNQQAGYQFTQQRQWHLHTQIQAVHPRCVQAPVEVPRETCSRKSLPDSCQVKLLKK